MANWLYPPPPNWRGSLALRSSAALAQAPALIDVAVRAHLRDLERRSVLAFTGRGGVDRGLDRHLFRIGTIAERLMEDTAIETGMVLNACEGQNGGRNIHIASWHTDLDPTFEMRPPGKKRVANGPGA